jgi:hypothetical protein
VQSHFRGLLLGHSLPFPSDPIQWNQIRKVSMNAEPPTVRVYNGANTNETIPIFYSAIRTLRGLQ